MASTAMDMDTLPSNVLLDDESYWSPHIRVGANWKDFLQFDFRATARVISVTVTVKKEGMKVPTKVSVEVSGTGVTWKTVVSKVALPEDGFIPVVPAQEARCSCNILLNNQFFLSKVCSSDDRGVRGRSDLYLVSWSAEGHLVRLHDSQGH